VPNQPQTQEPGPEVTQTPRKRGRPSKSHPIGPAPVQAPISVTIRFRSGIVDTFGCVTRSIQGNFIVFSMPEAGGFLQKNVYIAASEIASMTIVESPAAQQPPQVWQAPVPQPQPVAPRPPQQTSYEARKMVSQLGLREGPVGPESQVIDDNGNVTVVSAGFMS
jgi:hypothetical protein